MYRTATTGVNSSACGLEQRRGPPVVPRPAEGVGRGTVHSVAGRLTVAQGECPPADLAGAVPTPFCGVTPPADSEGREESEQNERCDGHRLGTASARQGEYPSPLCSRRAGRRYLPVHRPYQKSPADADGAPRRGDTIGPRGPTGADIDPPIAALPTLRAHSSTSAEVVDQKARSPLGNPLPCARLRSMLFFSRRRELGHR